MSYQCLQVSPFVRHVSEVKVIEDWCASTVCSTASVSDADDLNAMIPDPCTSTWDVSADVVLPVVCLPPGLAPVFDNYRQDNRRLFATPLSNSLLCLTPCSLAATAVAPIGTEACTPDCSLVAWREQRLVKEQPQGGNGACRMVWTVDALRLKGNDHVIVSPAFQLPGRGQISFRMMLAPKDAEFGSQAGLQASFKKSKGQGSVQLKCEAAIDDAMVGSIAFRIAVGDRGRLRGQPANHDFTQRALCVARPAGELARMVDKTTQTLTITLEVFTVGSN